jgi:hypothetical protein
MKTQHFERHSTMEIHKFFQLMDDAHIENPKKPKIKVGDLIVNCSSLRLQTFRRRGVKCVCCGIDASFFAFEKQVFNTQQNVHHANLWGFDKDGNEVLFTHDHTIARALGGVDNLSNTKTMCGPCNWAKGEQERVLVDNLRRSKKK